MNWSRFVLVTSFFAGCLLPQRALAEGAIRVPRVAAATDSRAHQVWASCVASAPAEKHFSALGVTPAAVTQFDRAAWETARARAVAEAPALTDVAQLKALLVPIAAQTAALSSACAAVLHATPLSVEHVRSIESLASNPDLGWIDAGLSPLARLAPDALTGSAVTAALTPPPVAASPSAPDSAPPAPTAAAATTPFVAPTMTDIVLSEVQRQVVREALSELLKGACEPAKYRPYFEATCGALEALGSATDVQGFQAKLYEAAQRDLGAMPLVALSRAARVDDSVATLWLVAVMLRDGLEHGDWPGILRGLSAFECDGTAGAACEQGTPQALKRLGAFALALDRHTHALAADLGAERVRLMAMLVALELSPSGSLEQVERGRQLAEAISADWQRLSSARADDGAKVLLDLVVAYLAAHAGSASPVDDAQLRSLQKCVLSARRGELGAGLAEATSLAAKAGAELPSEVRALVLVIETLRGKATAGELLAAFASSPWLTEKLGDRLRGRAPGRRFDPFGAAPERRPDTDLQREGLARYFGGVRAGYVYQHWKPEDISDVAYNTVGLNLLRLELLLNSDEVPALRLLDGYFRYEVAPGGQAEQDELVQLYESDASGWQAFVGELAAELPMLSSDDHSRGPAVGFTRRYFLASAQALKDYWYYDEQGVGLLAPGDTIRTSTVMTTYSLGFRDTTLSNSRPSWGWESGGFYLDYRKPYTHSRFTNVDRAAIFNATFRGLGAYATGRVFVPSSNADAPGQISLHAKFGRAEILLDDIAAEDVLPGSSGVFMVETTAEAQFPVVWFGGFFLGGMGHVTYRNFGDYFSGGEANASRVNDQSLNDDVVLGVTAQAGYLL